MAMGKQKRGRSVAFIFLHDCCSAVPVREIERRFHPTSAAWHEPVICEMELSRCQITMPLGAGDPGRGSTRFSHALSAATHTPVVLLRLRFFFPGSDQSFA
jgi:hypothetical protein